jgi:hypothetical protein
MDKGGRVATGGFIRIPKTIEWVIQIDRLIKPNTGVIFKPLDVQQGKIRIRESQVRVKLSVNGLDLCGERLALPGNFGGLGITDDMSARQDETWSHKEAGTLLFRGRDFDDTGT